MKSRWMLPVLLMLPGCDDGAAVAPATDTAVDAGLDAAADSEPFDSRVIEVPPPPEPVDPRALGLPTDADGDPLIETGAGLTLVLRPEPARPMGGLARCALWLRHCMADGHGDADDCTAAAPVCVIDPPWAQLDPCCPEGCLPQYREQRLAGQGKVEALLAVYVYRDGCFPEVAR